MNDGRRRAGLLLALCCSLFVAHLRCEAQNLVPNPSFEETDTCLLGLAFDSEFGLHDWFSAYLTPDHLQSCLDGLFNGLPMNVFTYQEPLDGSSCVGLFSYYQNGLEEQREWVMVQLTEPLVAGQTYYASFYANAGFGGNAQYPQIWLASNNIGMLFTMEPRPWNSFDPYPAALNSAHLRRTEILSDTVAWTLVSGSFVADSAYQYLMIGNFFSNALTDTLHFAPQGSPWEWFPRGYTLIDKVCVSMDPDGCDLADGIVDHSIGAVHLYPNPATDVLWVGSAQGAMGTVQDALGRRVWQGRVLAGQWMLDVRAWARGAYVLRLEMQGKQATFKFVLVE